MSPANILLQWFSSLEHADKSYVVSTLANAAPWLGLPDPTCESYPSSALPQIFTRVQENAYATAALVATVRELVSLMLIAPWRNSDEIREHVRVFESAIVKAKDLGNENMVKAMSNSRDEFTALRDRWHQHGLAWDALADGPLNNAELRTSMLTQMRAAAA